MKKIFIFISIFLLTTISLSYGIAWLAEENAVKFYFGIHSPLEVYLTDAYEDETWFPGIEFTTVQKLNDVLWFLAKGCFYNVA